jgi:tetratricopeptide (TPR) repeat protein
MSGLVDDLRARLADRRVVVVAGSGVTAAATNGNGLSSWSGLIASGIDRASQFPDIQTGVLDAMRSLSAVGDSNALIMAAELVTEALGGRGGGEYERWLRETVGSLELENSSVPAALVALGVPVATTNYDGLIERASGWERVTWLEGGAAQRALQGDDQAVMHLHGHWRAPESVVLGVRSYANIGNSGVAQALQRAMATMNSLLFVGVGDGASDPNFGALRDWLARTFADAEYRHYRLCLSDEIEELSAAHAAGERIFPIAYGECHEDLATFLGDLTVPRSPPRLPGADGAANMRATTLPAPPVTLGREDEVAEVVARLLAQPAQPVLLHGVPGIGKTNLTLSALHNPLVVERFAGRRWLVRCEVTESATGLAGELATTLGLSPQGDALEGVLAVLSQAPAVLALDNLETPWERDTLPVEALLAAIAQVSGVAVIASMRGLERPSGIRWVQPTQLDPLDLQSAKELFNSIAPEQFNLPELDALLEEMAGIPLAVELLAYAADGEPDLAHLTERWHDERAKLLTRGAADHPLLSIAVSIDTSWNSPAITDPAKRLLGLLGRLPDGVASDDLEILLPGEGPAAANLLRRRGLALEQAGRLRTLPPIRHHLADKHPPDEDDWRCTVDHYRKRTATLGKRVGRRGGGEAISRLSREVANINVALTQTLREQQDARGFVAAHEFIEAARFSGIDAAPVTEALFTAAKRSGDLSVIARAHKGAGKLALVRSEYDTAREAFEQAQALYGQLGDVLSEARCIQGLADVALARSKYDIAHDAYDRALVLFRQVPDVLGEANCIKGLGDIAFERTDYDKAQEANEHARLLYRQKRNVLGDANCIKSLGDVARVRGSYDTASDGYKRARALYQQIGDSSGEASCMEALGDIALGLLEHDKARDAYDQALKQYRKVGVVLGEANCILGLGDIALAHSEPTRARDAYERALSLYSTLKEPYSIGLSHDRLARLGGDPSTRCAHVADARKAWLSIKRDDLVSRLATEYRDCP